MSETLLSAAGAAVSAAARLEALARAMWRVKEGGAHPREVALERDGAISGLAELGLCLKRSDTPRRFESIYTQISVVATSLAYGTLGALPAASLARDLRVLAHTLSVPREERIS